MKQIIYVSTLAEHVSPLDIVNLVEFSKLSNKRANITGMLINTDNHFIQVIEGRAGIVECLFSRIQQDNRHRLVKKVSDKPIQSRDYKAWDMAFFNAPTFASSMVLNVSSRDELYQADGDLISRFLLSIRREYSID